MATQNVSPLVYSQLRMLAEASVGIASGESATFVFDVTGTNRSPATNILGPQVVPPGAPWPEQGVLVTASNQGKFTRPEGGVVVQVAGANGPGVNAVDYQADALFWSDAAVQKFVLPYYASCMGYEAYRQLAVLQEAWSGSHEGFTVVALMHVTGTPAGPAGEVAPMEPLWIVYLQESDNTVCAQSLADFSRANPATLPRLERPAPGPYVAPARGVGSPYPDYTTLRSMAEWAAALDTEPMYFTYDQKTRQFRGPSAQMGAEGAIVLPVLNPSVRAGRVESVEVDFGNCRLGPEADAVFWSTGAIEQFLLPYYASLDGFAGLADLQALRDAWTGNRFFIGGNLLVDGEEVQLLGPPDEPLTVTGIEHIWPSMIMTDVQFDRTAASREINLLQTDGSGRVARSRLNARAEEAAGAA